MKRSTPAWAFALLSCLLLAACSDQRRSTETPHPFGSAWLSRQSTQFHGSPSVLNSMDCSDCHDLGEKCSECHFDANGSRVPAGVSWTHGSLPHDFLTSYASVCNRCHSVAGVFPAVNCTTACHAQANHPFGQAWLDKDVVGFHGDVANADVTSCQPCHGNDYQGGFTEVGCFTCHFSPEGNMSPDGAAHVAFSAHSDFNQSFAVCNACHQTNRQYGNVSPDVNCAVACHVDANHPFGQAWLDKDVVGFHGDAANADLNSCQPCHGADFQGGSTGVGCVTCHFSPQGNMSPTGAAHVALLGHWDFNQSFAVCNACHQTNVQFGNVSPTVTCAVACHANHEGQAWLDKKVEGFHGDAANADIVSCQTCHGADYRGGFTGVGCVACHFTPEGWKSPTGLDHVGFEPEIHSAFQASESVCNLCHATNRLFGNAPGACHDCH